MTGRSLHEYASPLFLAWQLTNRCEASCLACCEASGPAHAWRDELNREQALDLADQIVSMDIPYVAFGGGEPLSVPYCWEIFERLSAAGTAIKLETNGHHIDITVADRLCSLGVQCVQISLDGADEQTHRRVRPGSSFNAALDAVDALVSRGIQPQWVFVPTRLNIEQIVPAFQLAIHHRCSAFVTGPLMRLGRAAAAWDRLACDDNAWTIAADSLRQELVRAESSTALYIYPWDILTELERRLASPQAMLLVVPNGRVKLLNALPFSPADIRRHSLLEAWQAYRRAWREPAVRDFIGRCRTTPDLLRHANEVWEMP